MKTEARAEARRLRRQEGRSIKEIARVLGVSRSSVSLWVRDVPLTNTQREALRLRNPIYNAQLRGSAANAAHARRRRLQYQLEGRRRARLGDATYAAGCMLYWAEGDKANHAVRLANSDPALVRFFADFLRTRFDVDDSMIRVTCNLYADHERRQRQIEDFWLDVIGVPRSALCRSIVNRYSKYSQKKRKNRLPYGTCRLAVHRVAILQTIFGSIQEIAEFDRPEWLR